MNQKSRKKLESQFTFVWIKKRLFYVFCLMFCATILWLLAFGIFEISRREDAYAAFRLYPQLLSVSKILIFACVVFFAIKDNLSVGWPLSMCLIAILVSAGLYHPPAASDHFIRTVLITDEFYQFQGRTSAFAVFSIVQIFGITLARPRGEQEKVRGTVSENEGKRGHPSKQF